MLCVVTYSLFLFQELKDQATRDLEKEFEVGDRNLLVEPRSYLWKDVFGMVSFQKSLVKNIYITPIWFNGIFVVPTNNGSIPNSM